MLRDVRRWVFDRERFLWLRAELPAEAVVPLPATLRLYSYEQRQEFLAALPVEFAVRLMRLWEALPRTWVFAAVEGDALAYYCFVSRGSVWIEEFGHFRTFAEGEVYVHTCYAFPAYRGRGLHSRTLQAVCRWLGGQGFRTAFAVVAQWNVPSLRGFQRAGFQVAGSVVHWTVLGYRFRSQPVWSC
jgi:L-amino acid N-acyltransferase YncA